MILDNAEKKDSFFAWSGFNNVFVVSGNITDAKTVTFPQGYDNDDYVCCKLLFAAGHNPSDASDNLKINGKDVVVYNNLGNLVKIPNYTDSNGLLKCIGAGTILDVYHISNWNGNNEAWVVVGNPVRLHYENFDILADGTNTALQQHPVESFYWTHSSVSPAVTFGGGTWEQIKGVFLWAKEDLQTAGDRPEDGVKTVTLTQDQIPGHTHRLAGDDGSTEKVLTTSANNRGHTHTYVHTHELTPLGSVANHSHDLSSHYHSMENHVHGMTHSHTVNSHAHRIYVTELTTTASGGSIGTAEGRLSLAWGTGPHTSGFVQWAAGSFDSPGTRPIEQDETSGDSSLLFNHSHTFTNPTCSTIIHFDSENASWRNDEYTASSSPGTSDSPANTGGPSVTNTGGPSNNNSGSTQPAFTGSTTTTSSQSASTTSPESQDHTHTLNVGNLITTSTGGGELHTNMPPYQIEYCWKRMA